MLNAKRGTNEGISGKAGSIEVETSVESPYDILNENDLLGIVDSLESIEFTPIEGTTSQSFEFGVNIPEEESSRGAGVDMVSPSGVFQFVNPTPGQLGENVWDTITARSGVLSATATEGVLDLWNDDKYRWEIVPEENDSHAMWIEAAESIRLLVDIDEQYQILILGATEGVQTGGTVFSEGSRMFLIQKNDSENDLESQSKSVLGVQNISLKPSAIQIAEFEPESVAGSTSDRMVGGINRVIISMVSYPGGAGARVTFAGSTNFRADTYDEQGNLIDGTVDQGIRLFGETGVINSPITVEG
jgi:hypothetical protein